MAGDNIRVRPTKDAIWLTLEKYGYLVRGTIKFVTTGAQNPVTAWESIAMPGDSTFDRRFEIMAKSLAFQRVEAITTAPGTPAVPADERRLALIISPPSSGTFTISLNTGTTTGGGIILTTTSNPLMLNIWDHGHIVRETFHISHSAGGVNIGVWELLEQ